MDDTTTMIANEITNFGEKKQKILVINITSLSEEKKAKLRGAIKYFSGDKNNINVFVQIGEEQKPCGQIYLTEEILSVFREIAGIHNVILEDK